MGLPRSIVGYGLMGMAVVMFVLSMVLFCLGIIHGVGQSQARQEAKESCLDDPACDYARFSDRWDNTHPYAGEEAGIGFSVMLVATMTFVGGSIVMGWSSP